MSIVSSRQSVFMGYRQSQTMLTAAQLHELLNYNPRTGAFHWKMSAAGQNVASLLAVVTTLAFVTSALLDGFIQQAASHGFM